VCVCVCVCVCVDPCFKFFRILFLNQCIDANGCSYCLGVLLTVHSFRAFSFSSVYVDFRRVLRFFHA
jgi:hypothetical protein